MKKYYYELSFYGNEKATRESLENYGESGFSWYVKSSLPLTQQQAINKCVREHKKNSNYEEFIKAIPYCDSFCEISGDEFESYCGIGK